MKYKYAVVNIKPMPLEVILDDDSQEYKRAQKEVALAESAPEILSHLKTTLFHLETVAHLRGLESEILPFVDMVKKDIKKFE